MKTSILYIDALIFKNNKAFGYQEFLFNLLDYFYNERKLIHYAEIVLLIPKSEVDIFKKYTDRFTLMDFCISSKFQHLKIQNSLDKYIKFKHNDVILFTYNYSSLKKYCKHILVVHDLLFLRKKYLPNFFMRMQRKISIPISFKKADKIITISNFTKNDIIANYQVDAKKIVTIYNFFNFDKYKVIDSYFKCDKPYFVSICSNAYHKNTLSVLKAYVDFYETNSDYDIVFIGALTDNKTDAYIYYQGLNEDIKKHIHLLSNVSNAELGMIYRNAKCFISLTLFEGLGMPIVEAMYFDLPLIISDLEVCREIVSDDSMTFLVSPFDIDNVSMKMNDMVGLEQKVKRGSIIAERFSAENTSKKYIDVLNSLSE